MIVDAHTHVFPQYALLAVEVMDRCGIDRVVTLEWHDGFGDDLRRHLDIFNAHEGRFTVFGNLDWSRINDPGFGDAAARQMREGAGAGMRGLKVYKALGLEYRKPNGEFWQICDPALDPIWAAAGELRLPVLIHCADPVYFWQPVDDANFWNSVLYGEYAWWSYYQGDYPSREQLLADRNEVISRHPGTVFICPHMGSKSDCLQRAAQDLKDFPNLYYDISARIPILGQTGERALESRQFMIEFQDRVLFGTDIIYDDTNVPTGTQAQCLYQPGAFPLGDENPESRYVETTVAFFQSHLDFLTTDQVQTAPPFNRCRDGFSITGLDLPKPVCAKLLHENAARLICGS